MGKTIIRRITEGRLLWGWTQKKRVLICIYVGQTLIRWLTEVRLLWGWGVKTGKNG